MFIGFFKLTATLSATVFISVFVKGQNPNDYKWPEAESNCRPLVFQIRANLMTFNNSNLFAVNYRSFVRGFIQATRVSRNICRKLKRVFW